MTPLQGPRGGHRRVVSATTATAGPPSRRRHALDGAAGGAVDVSPIRPRSPHPLHRALHGADAGPALALFALALAACSDARRDAEPSADPSTTAARSALPAAASVATPPPPPPKPRCPDGMVFLEGGTFQMGADDGDANQRPAHAVEVARFCIDTTEVTVAAYTACVQAKACAPAARVDSAGVKALHATCNGDREDRKDHPANCMSGTNAEAYCTWAGRRLPTEEEWEFAARGVAGRRYPWGDEPPGPDRLNMCGKECHGFFKARYGVEFNTKPEVKTEDPWVHTAPVGSFPKGATPEGVLDLEGNVVEWTSSPYCPFDAPGCKTDKRVEKGAGWLHHELREARATFRDSAAMTSTFANDGFRCASSPTSP